MKRVHIFNPENDLALAGNSDHYTPPKAAIAFHKAGELLPLWYGDDGDCLITGGVNRNWLEQHYKRFGERVSIFSPQHAGADCQPSPWGWSKHARTLLTHHGFRRERLPDDDSLDVMRNLSHRRTIGRLSIMLAEKLDFDIAPPAKEFDSMAQLAGYLSSIEEDVIVKSPWSSSGRGLLDSRMTAKTDLLRRCEGTIRRQGSVMVEQVYDKCIDFALLYECSRGKCNFTGYSVFSTDSKGGYTGNVLAPDETLLEKLNRHYPAERIEKVAKKYSQIIERTIAPSYNGCLGIDMLIAEEKNGKPLLNAGVELNLRMTMGHVAHRLTRNFLAPLSTGIYSTVPANANPVSDTMTIENGKMLSGRINLTPPGGLFSFVADVQPL